MLEMWKGDARDGLQYLFHVAGKCANRLLINEVNSRRKLATSSARPWEIFLSLTCLVIGVSDASLKPDAPCSPP
jgi:hypothetical protein